MKKQVSQAKAMAMATFLCLTAIMAASAWGSYGPDADHAGGRTPPKEAIEACRDKSEGATVEITTPRGDKVKGICKEMNGELVALPERRFPPPGRPPAEASNGQQERSASQGE